MNPGNGFDFVFEINRTIKIYFYINKRLNINKQNIIDYKGNLYIFKIIREKETVGNLNIYNLLPGADY